MNYVFFSVMITFEATKGQYVMQNCALNPMVVLVFAEKEWKVSFVSLLCHRWP